MESRSGGVHARGMTAANNEQSSLGGPALSEVDACCMADANAKQEGKTGCGCASWIFEG